MRPDQSLCMSENTRSRLRFFLLQAEGPHRVILAVALTLLTVLALLPNVAHAQALERTPNTLPAHESISDFWRAIRHGEKLKPSQGLAAPQRVIQSDGEVWRQYRATIRFWGGLIILAALAGILLFVVLRRPVAIESGRSHRLIPRFTLLQRVIHWSVAFTFILLALSGAVLLFGRLFLPQTIGPAAFSAVASAAKEGHNLFGPLFIVALLALIALYVRDNIPSWTDVTWFFRGGLFFVSHLPAGKFNGGEKLWFWGVTVLGLVLAVTGTFLDFPFLANDLIVLQVSQLLHATAAVLLIAGAMGHIYLGSVGTEGTIDGMITGCVDENWARQHHDLWLEALRKGDEPSATACPQSIEQLIASTTMAENQSANSDAFAEAGGHSSAQD